MQSSVYGKIVEGYNYFITLANSAFGVLPALWKQAIKRRCQSISGDTADLII